MNILNYLIIGIIFEFEFKLQSEFQFKLKFRVQSLIT